MSPELKEKYEALKNTAPADPNGFKTAWDNLPGPLQQYVNAHIATSTKTSGIAAENGGSVAYYIAFAGNPTRARRDFLEKHPHATIQLFTAWEAQQKMTQTLPWGRTGQSR